MGAFRVSLNQYAIGKMSISFFISWDMGHSVWCRAKHTWILEAAFPKLPIIRWQRNYLAWLTYDLVSASAAHHVRVNFLWTKQLHITQGTHFHVSLRSLYAGLIQFAIEIKFSILIQDRTFAWTTRSKQRGFLLQKWQISLSHRAFKGFITWRRGSMWSLRVTSCIAYSTVSLSKSILLPKHPTLHSDLKWERRHILH